MAIFQDSIVYHFITSPIFNDLAKGTVVIIVIGFMVYQAVKPRIQASDKVQL